MKNAFKINSSKIIKISVLAALITSGFVGFINYCSNQWVASNFYSISLYEFLTKYLFGIPYLVMFYFIKIFGKEESIDHNFWLWIFSILTFFTIFLLLTLLAYVSKLKRKYLSGLLVLTLFVFANVGAAKILMSELIKPDWQTFKYDTFHVSLESPYPLISDPEIAKWVEKNNAGKIYIDREMKAETSVTHLFLVTVECKEYVDRAPSLDKLKSSWQKVVVAGEVQPSTCAGLPAIELYGSGSNRVLVTVKGKFEYYFGVIYSKERGKDGKEMADRFFNSIKIQD